MTSPALPSIPVLRVARPTDSISDLLPFYQAGLGFEILARFEDHNGFDGIILGHPAYPYHVEFTHHRGHTVNSAPSQDNLLVFYFPDKAAWQEQINRMQQHGFAPVPSYNPYWDARGKTFEDADGYRVVLYQGAWTL